MKEPLFHIVDSTTYTFSKSGKVKNVYESRDNNLLFDFTDQISVFDKVIPTRVPRKGEALCRGTAYWFEKVQEKNICNIHYIRMVPPNQMLVKKADIVEKPTPETDSYFIPIEVICRHYAAGSLVSRIDKGKLKPEDVGLTSPPKVGDKLPEPYIEATTKFEKFDRSLSYKETLEITGLTKDEYEQIKDTVLKIDEMIAREIEPRGLIHADGKKEFAFGPGRTLMLVDTFGTGDEDRFWNKQAYENGQLIELSKEFVRQYYKKIRYHDRLIAAREGGYFEPEIPALPKGMDLEVSNIYAQLHEMLTGEVF